MKGQPNPNLEIDGDGLSRTSIEPNNDFSNNDATLPKIDPVKDNDEILKNDDTIIDNVLDEILTSTKSVKPKSKATAPRKDLVNKNILRVISRFLKSLLKQHVPDSNSHLKSAAGIVRVLDTLVSKLFPMHPEKEELKYILGAFVLGNAIQKIPLPTHIQTSVLNIHRCLTKYTHNCLNQMFKCVYTK